MERSDIARPGFTFGADGLEIIGFVAFEQGALADAEDDNAQPLVRRRIPPDRQMQAIIQLPDELKAFLLQYISVAV